MQIERRKRHERRSIDLSSPAEAGAATLLGLEPLGIGGVGGAAEQRHLLAAAAPPAAAALVALLAVVSICAVGRISALALAAAAGPALAAPAALLALWGWQREAATRKLRQPWIARGSVLLAALAGVGWGDLVSAPDPIASEAVLAFTGGAALLVLALTPLPAAAAAAALAMGVGAGLALPDWSATLEGLLSAAAAALMMARMMQIRLGTAASGAKSAAQAHKAGVLLADFESSGKGWFWETDQQGRITYVSPQLAEQLGREPDALLGTPLTDLFADESATGEHSPRGERTVNFHLSAKLGFTDAQVRAAGIEPPRFWALSGRPAADEEGRFVGFRGSGTDLTEMRRSEAEVSRLARFDALTNLPNRVQMRQTLETSMREASVNGRACALMLLDLDRFKSVNDTLGHPVGDALLRQVAERLMSVIGEHGRVGRLGGDEFKVVVPNATDRPELAGLAERIIERLSAPYMIDGATVSIGASVGVAVSPADGDCPDALIRNADLALYAAKADGKGRHRFYQEAMHETARDRRLLEIDLRNALADGTGLHLQFQPIVRCDGEVITGFEALSRWTHPTRGEVSPALFIPLAEEIGLIPQIGAWVIRNACQQAARWPDQVRVAVNISPIQFANPALPAIILSALAETQLAPNRLELEITEGVFMNDSAATDAMFARLSAIGVRFALDDFGTGYSSLGYLKRAPFNKIKIDQSFVRGIAIKGNRNAAIVKAIVALADSLGMETTAEGAETHDELDFLRSLACTHVQGFIFGRPMVADEAFARVQGDARLTADGFAAARPPRIAVLRSALLYYGDQRQAVRVRNISEGGAMAETDRDVPCGCAVELAFPNGERIRGEVRWTQAGRFGIQFEEAFQISKLPGARATIDPRYAA